MGMPNAFPYEVIGSPSSIYIAPVGTARPTLAVDPSAPWVLLGQRGNRSYAEEGVGTNSPAAYNYFRGLGSAAPSKAFRSEEDVMVRVSLADLSLESLANAYNQLAADVNESGTTRTLNLSRGLSVLQVAVLIRMPSPYMDDGDAQWWIPNAANVSSPEIVMRRDNATIYALEWRALYYDDATAGEEMGVFEAEDETT